MSPAPLVEDFEDVQRVLDSLTDALATSLWLPDSSVFPLNPTNGQIFDYIADATNGIVWRFRYRVASASAFKWEFVGGPPLSYVGADALVDTFTSLTYVVLPTNPITLNLPLAGDYYIRTDCRLGMSAAGFSTVAGLALAGVVNAQTVISQFFAAANSPIAHLSRLARVNGVVAATPVTWRVLVEGGTGKLFQRGFEVLPIRVG